MIIVPKLNNMNVYSAKCCDTLDVLREMFTLQQTLVYTPQMLNTYHPVISCTYRRSAKTFETLT
jgi:hypothetical protein